MRTTGKLIAAALLVLAASRPAASQSSPIDSIRRFLGARPELPEDVWAVAPEEEVQDVLFLGESRPALIRLRIRVRDKGFRTAWGDFVGRLHAYLDRDGDGVLTKDEAEDAPALKLLANGFNPGQGGGPRLAIDTSPADGVVSVAELTRFLRSSFGPFQLRPGPPPDGRAEALFGRLDRDGDGKLSADERASAAAALRSADADDDELISASELMPYSNPFLRGRMNFGMVGSPRPLETPFLALAPGESRSDLVRQLLKRYDNGGPRRAARPRDGTLARAEIGLPPAAFDRADANRDDRLDANELARLLDHLPPDLETAVVFDRPRGPFALEPVAAAGRAAATSTNPPRNPADPGGIKLSLDGVEIELRVNYNAQELKQFYEAQFRGADGDGNKYLDEKEGQRSYPFNQLFKVMDRDGDGKLFLEEVSAFAERQQDASRSRVALTASDRGRALFELLDADGDGRLGPRELRDVARRLLTADRDGDGRIVLAEIPRQYRLTISRGAVGFPFGEPTEMEVGREPPGADRPGRFPTWFDKMDRNRDGEVSAREFLGPRADFDRLDANRDGLIDAGEAARP